MLVQASDCLSANAEFIFYEFKVLVTVSGCRSANTELLFKEVKVIIEASDCLSTASSTYTADSQYW